MITFTKEVSKGSRFNQVYIPKSLSEVIEAGDIVEVKLIRKVKEDFYTNRTLQLSDFKQRLIKDIFNVLKQYPQIQQAYIVGSFLTKIVGYDDIDLMLVVDKEDEAFEKELDKKLTTTFNQRFHILLYTREKLQRALERCPITRSMFTSCVSNKPVLSLTKRIIDINYLKYLLMFPEDLLEVELPGKPVYGALRKIVTIYRFLEKKPLYAPDIEKELLTQLGKKLVERLISNATLHKREFVEIRSFLRRKIRSIKTLL